MKRNREVYCGCDANVSKAVAQMFFGTRKKNLPKKHRSAAEEMGK